MTNNNLPKIQRPTLSSNVVDTTNYAVPVGAFTALLLAFLRRYYPDMGDEVHTALVAFSGIAFNYLLVIFRFFWKGMTEKYVIDK